jgi:hypothetical protein
MTAERRLYTVSGVVFTHDDIVRLIIKEIEESGLSKNVEPCDVEFYNRVKLSEDEVLLQRVEFSEVLVGGDAVYQLSKGDYR